MMAGYWPHPSGSFADRTNRLPKLVVSSTLEETPWGEWDNARPVTGVLADAVAKLKNEPGDDIVTYGSGSIVQALTRLGRDRRVVPRREPSVARCRQAARRAA
jgi:dihydrofolate reductase